VNLRDNKQATTRLNPILTRSPISRPRPDPPFCKHRILNKPCKFLSSGARPAQDSNQPRAFNRRATLAVPVSVVSKFFVRPCPLWHKSLTQIRWKPWRY